MNGAVRIAIWYHDANFRTTVPPWRSLRLP